MRRAVVAYDITDDHRRVAVARLLLRHGVRIQRSVFELELTDDELAAVVEALSESIKPTQDVVQVFGQCQHCLGGRITMGQSVEVYDTPFWII